jgi:5'-nucleotidase / UDP-sugar diphosphatase
MKKKSVVPLLVIWFLFVAINGLWAGEPVQLRILYLNDFHGFAEPYKSAGNPDMLGGIAYLAGEAKRLRQERPTLLLAAGDMIQGNQWANLYEGKSSIEVMNAMDFSAMVLGNHEFDFGQEVLKKRIQEAKFPVLAANVQGVPGIKPYVIKELSGIKIAVIGLVTETTPSATHPKNVKGLVFSSPIQSAKKVLKELGDKPDLVIVLSHLGFPADRRLAEAVRGIQVIVGGHTHTRIETPFRVNETLIVQAWEHAKALGVLDLTIQDGKVLHYEGELLPVDPERLKPDPLVLKIVNQYKNQAATIIEEKIGETRVDLQGTGSRIQETNLGDLVTDILRKETKADVALINGGGIRAEILKGAIRMKDLFSVLPFRNYPMVIKVTGKELKAVLEHGLSDLTGTSGQFPQISGMCIRYNPAFPEGRRITAISVQDKPLNPEGWYTLATNDFLASGGDGYAVLVNILANKRGYPKMSPRVVLFDSGREIRELVTGYIKEKKTISASVEGRIQKSE